MNYKEKIISLLENVNNEGLLKYIYDFIQFAIKK